MDLSDEEKHALELRRERSNKISKTMGEYLLKGYKMLGTSCNKCGTILMRDRQQNEYCVACNDIDGLTSRNNSQQIQMPISAAHETRHTGNQMDSTAENRYNTRGAERYSGGSSLSQTDEYRGVMKEAERTLLMKMEWACTQLQNCNLEDSFRLLQLINACHEMLTKLKLS